MDLYSFSISSTQFSYTYLKHKLTEPTSLQLEKINCIIEDHNGTIWLGANGNGLYQLAEENGTQFTFHNYTRKDGLPNNTIIGIVEDKTGHLWMSTNHASPNWIHKP